MFAFVPITVAAGFLAYAALRRTPKYKKGEKVNAVAGVAAFGFFFLVAILSKNKIGGADVKFIAACMFVCGVSEGTAGLILGLMLSVIGTLIRNKKNKSKDKTLPMIPYLSVGFLTAYMIGGLIT